MSKLPSPKSKKIRQAIIDTCREMNASGLNQGTSGNVSARVKGGMLITPSGRPYKTMKPKDIVFMRDDGSYKGDLVPSTEWRFHLDIMNSRPEVNAIVHAHPTFSTTLAILKKGIPPLHYMVAVAGGPDIRCAPYATFGTAELSKNALKALEDRSACLLAHHGMIALGPDLAKAFWLAVEVETLAKQYYYTLQAGGPPLLSAAEIKNVAERIHSYGPRSDTDGDASTKPKRAAANGKGALKPKTAASGSNGAKRPKRPAAGAKKPEGKPKRAATSRKEASKPASTAATGRRSTKPKPAATTTDGGRQPTKAASAEKATTAPAAAKPARATAGSRTPSPSKRAVTRRSTKPRQTTTARRRPQPTVKT